MNTLKLTFIIVILAVIGCNRKDNNTPKYVPTDVLVKIKSEYSIDKAFDFINSFSLSVENIHSLTYTSDLPKDSLQYILDFVNGKPYASATGYVSTTGDTITIFPKLINIKNKSYQNDWLETVTTLKLHKKSGCIIYFHVPAGQEPEWKEKFEQYECVEWAELNYLLEISLW